MSGRWFAASVVVAVLWAVAASPATYGARVLETVPDGLGEPVAFVGLDQLESPSPRPLLDGVRRLLQVQGGVLLVGRTDPSGPRGLNRVLSVEMARTVAHRLRADLGADAGQVACAGWGEVPTASPGVAVYGWRPPQEHRRPGSRVSLVTPNRGTVGRRLWAFWAQVDTVEWGTTGEGVDGGVWRVPSAPGKVVLPFPSPAAATAVAVGNVARVDLGAVSLSAAVPDPSLTVQVVSRSPWTATVSGAVPPGSTKVRLWAAGIPYPVQVDRVGRVGVQVALWPGRRRAWLEATNSAGIDVTGIPVVLPAGEGAPPDLWMVLVWDDDGVDLDLHGWAKKRHTHPGAPDPVFTPGAVAGSRLLFDGKPGSPASSLVVWGDDGLQVDVRCFGALGRARTRAWMYVVRKPGDPVAERRTVLGPRWLSEGSLERRWPVLGFDGKQG